MCIRDRTRALVMTGLFAALGCVATLVLQIPSPTGGYLNLGDTVVILGAYLLGPALGAAAGGVGPALADLLSGYTVYVPVSYTHLDVYKRQPVSAASITPHRAKRIRMDHLSQADFSGLERAVSCLLYTSRCV